MIIDYNMYIDFNIKSKIYQKIYLISIINPIL